MAEAQRRVVCPSCGAVNRLPASRPAAQAKCGACHAQLFGSRPAEADAASFDRNIARNDIPVVVDFWAPWCGPCRAMAPVLERAAAELEPDYRIIKVNTDVVPEIAGRYGIRSLPTLILFAGGSPVAQTGGPWTGSASSPGSERMHRAAGRPERQRSGRGPSHRRPAPGRSPDARAGRRPSRRQPMPIPR